MGRKIDEKNIYAVLEILKAQDGNVRLNNVAKEAGLHPEQARRALASMQDVTGVLLQEDDKGFLGIFKGK